MKKLLVAASLAAAAPFASAHGGHGLDGTHWHATDAWGFALLGVIVRAVLLDSARQVMVIPGELLTDAGDHVLNPGRRTLTLVVENSGDRPIQVGSHYHFAETNARAALRPRALRAACG